MSFQPVLPFGGLQGWIYLQRTYDVQSETFKAQSQLQRSIEYFRDNIGSVSSAADLASDRRLREVALGAFGLEGDTPNVYFVQRLLSDGVASDDALANRLADVRYREFGAAFGLGPGETSRTGDTKAMEDIVKRFSARSFEAAVGEQDESMRIALFANRKLAELASGPETEKTKWYSVLGQPPLKALFETALGLPSSFGQADLDRQLEVYQDRVAKITGDRSVSQFSDPEVLDRLITVYQARAQISTANAAFSPAATALALLSQS